MAGYHKCCTWKKDKYKNQQILTANIINCDFRNTLFSVNIDNEFLTRLFFNGAKVPSEYMHSNLAQKILEE